MSIPNELPLSSFEEATHILFHVFLTCFSNAFSDLKAHLGSGIIDEAPEARTESSIGALARLGLVWIAIAVGCLLLLRDWWWRRSHHRHGRDMLRNWMVERRGLRWRRCKC
jgi:hypothetical protein